MKIKYSPMQLLRRMNSVAFVFISLIFISCFSSCSTNKKISRQANNILFRDSIIDKSFIGISIYEPAADRFWYNYNSNKYFIPASNTKLFTLYAGMSYLGDSLAAASIIETSNNIDVFPTGDPTFLHPDYLSQPLFDLLKNSPTNITIVDTAWKEFPLGNGWAWDDYADAYMAERSSLPVFGNVVHISNDDRSDIIPAFFSTTVSRDSLTGLPKRQWDKNVFHVNKNNDQSVIVKVPFITSNGATNIDILESVLQRHVSVSNKFLSRPGPSKKSAIFSQAVDSVFKPMMFRSDNFFAEQTLLMVSNKILGYMNDDAIIDTILKTALKDIPQKPRWVDGSGLSRYNLFTPQSMVYILNKLSNEFGIDRMKRLLPTGGEGTLSDYYLSDKNYIFAKTGGMGNQVCISGYLLTKKGKWLSFSVLANHFMAKQASVRQLVERFISSIREQY